MNDDEGNNDDNNVYLIPAHYFSCKIMYWYMRAADRLLGMMLVMNRFSDETDTLEAWRANLRLYVVAAASVACKIADSIADSLGQPVKHEANCEELFGEFLGMVADIAPHMVSQTRSMYKEDYDRAMLVVTKFSNYAPSELPIVACKEFGNLLRKSAELSTMLYDAYHKNGYFETNTPSSALVKVQLHAICQNGLHYAKLLKERYPDAFNQ